MNTTMRVTMNRILQRYLILALVVLCSVLLYIVLNYTSNIYFDNLTQKYKHRYSLGLQEQFLSVNYGLQSALNVTYRLPKLIKPEKNIILLGASTTREGVLPDFVSIPDGWTLTNFGNGGETPDTLRLMYNFINLTSDHTIDKSDIVVLHIWYKSLHGQAPQKIGVYRAIDLFGYYNIDPQMNVSGSPQPSVLGISLANFKIKMFFSLLVLDKYKMRFGPNKLTFRNALYRARGTVERLLKMNSPKSEPLTEAQRIDSYREIWLPLLKVTDIPGQTTEKFLTLLSDLQKRTNVVVVNLYHPSWHDDYPMHKEYRKWVADELIPELRKKKIEFLDYTNDFDDSLFYDSAHLSRDGRIKYSEIFSKDISNSINKLSLGAGAPSVLVHPAGSDNLAR